MTSLFLPTVLLMGPVQLDGLLYRSIAIGLVFEYLAGFFLLRNGMPNASDATEGLSCVFSPNLSGMQISLVAVRNVFLFACESACANFVF